MSRVLLPVCFGLAALTAFWTVSVEPAAAQFGNDIRSPYRSPASGFSPYTPSYGNLFSPYQSYRLHDVPPPDYSTYRTLCVRMCDGFYFPISHATRSANFTRDAEQCTATCGEDARLFYYPNPGGELEAMVDLTGRAYGSYPTAFKYRKTLVKGCQCRPAPWTETERARHRAYAAAQLPDDGAADPDMPVKGSSATAPVASYRAFGLTAPGAINRADFEDVATPPLAGAPASTVTSPPLAARLYPAPARVQPWNGLFGDTGYSQRRSAYTWPGGR